MSDEETSGAVIVGVHPEQSVAVLREGAQLARALARPLVCAYVTEDSYLAEWDRAEVREDASLHPGVASEEEGVALELAGAIATALESSTTGEDPPPWTLRLLAGDPAKALGRLATEVDARLLVVGTRGRGVERALEEWLGGSIAAHLAHDQARPVVVVPLHAALVHGGVGETLSAPR